MALEKLHFGSTQSVAGNNFIRSRRPPREIVRDHSNGITLSQAYVRRPGCSLNSTTVRCSRDDCSINRCTNERARNRLPPSHPYSSPTPVTLGEAGGSSFHGRNLPSPRGCFLNPFLAGFYFGYYFCCTLIEWQKETNMLSD